MKSILVANEEGWLSFERLREGKKRYGFDPDFIPRGEYETRRDKESKDVERRRRVFEEGIYP